MTLPALAARCLRASPKKSHIAIPLLVMAALYWLSSLPGVPLADDKSYALLLWISPAAQNLLHVPAYALLAATLQWFLRAWLDAPTLRTIIACAVAVSYGVFDEWHQTFVPGRYSSLTDIVFNVVGVVLGIWLATWASRCAARNVLKDTPMSDS